MKIDFVISSLTGGGAQRVLILLANALVQKGYHINIVTFNAPDIFVADKRVGRVRLHEGKIKNHKLRAIYNLIKYYSKKEKRPAIIISFLTSTNFISIPVAKLFGIKIIASEHINYLRSDSVVDNFTRKYLYRYDNFLTVLTKFDVPYYQKFKAKPVVMPNPSSFVPLQKDNMIRKKVILAVGSLNRYEHKGFDNLLYILKPILEEFPEWRLKILGKGDKGMNYLKNLSIELQIEKNIEFAGFKSNVSEIMQQSSIFILSSRYEGLPMVLIEAMSQGMACIAYDCITGPSDIIKNGYDGLLIDNQNREAMRAGLAKLIGDNTLRKKLASNAIHSINRYQIDNIVKKWEDLFQRLCT